MKILICSEFYAPHIGGVEQHSFQLANFFKNRGHNVEIVTSFIKNRKIKNNSIKINQFKIKGNLVRGYNGNAIDYQNFLIKSNFNIIFFNAAQQWTFDLALPIITKINSKKILFPCGFSKFNNIFYKPYFFIFKKLINEFDEIICVSKKFRDYKFIKGFYKKKINVIENGGFINKPIYSKLKFQKKFNINKEDKIICNISNVKFFKGQDRSISIFKDIKKTNTKLFLIGNNFSKIYYLYIKLLVFLFNKNQNKKKIILLTTSEKEAKTILQYSDVFLFTSRKEYDPLVIKEAIIANVNFISYDVGIVKEYCSQDFGFCSNNIYELSKKLDEFLNKKKKIKLNTKQYLWKNVLPKYYKIFLKR